MVTLRFRRDSAIGLALSPERLVAIGESQWTRLLDPSLPMREELERAFAELRQWCGEGDAALHVVLAPPLAETRLLSLPPLHPRELVRLLARDSARFFLAPVPGLVDGRRMGNNTGGRNGVLAAWGRADVVEALYQAAAANGLSIARVMPAVPAWAAAAASMRPAIGDGTAAVAILIGGRADVIRLDHGRIIALRRRPFGPDASGGPELANVLHQDAPDSTLVLADTTAACTLPEVLGPAESEAPHADPLVLAASAAPRSGQLEFVPPAVAVARARARRRLASALWAAAAACACVAIGLDWWGLAREYHHVAERRAGIRNTVTEAMQVRDELSSLVRRIERLAELERTAPRWTATLADVADGLPRGAYLIGLHAAGDSVVLEGLAPRVGLVFDGLRRAPAIVAVRAAAPVRQETREGAAADHFLLVGRSAPAERPPR
jgi:hypothetical protein